MPDALPHGRLCCCTRSTGNVVIPKKRFIGIIHKVPLQDKTGNINGCSGEFVGKNIADL
jgi:hypothetical protein